MPKRLAAKLIVALVILVAVIEGIFSYVNFKAQERQILASMIVGADQLSRSITSATWHAMLADQRQAAYDVMQTIATKQGIDRIRIFNKEGRIMFSTDPEAGTRVDESAEACFMCHAREQPLVRVDVPTRARTYRGADGSRKLGMITPFYNEPSCSTAACHAHPAERSVLGVLDVTMGLSHVDRELAGLKLRTTLVVLFELVLMAAFIVLFTHRFVQKPIHQLIEGTKAVSAMHLDRPIVIDSSEELGELARSFNIMRERLQKAMSALNELTRSLEDRVRERTAQLDEAQRNLVRSDRLASLGQLAASVAHEINNPLSGVLNLSMLMQRIVKPEGIPPGRVDEFRRYLAQVANETSRVGRIVSDLLAFSRRSRHQVGVADLNAIIGNSVSLIAHKMELAKVRLTSRLQNGIPRISCDASQIQQVVMNLLLNATESVTAGGEVTVETDLDRSGDAVILRVSDTGVGIQPEHLGRIFDPFFTTKEEGKGVGLGLSVVYGIVQAHGGEIDVESVPNRGTTFQVRLPIAAAGRAGVSSAGGAAG